LQQFSDEYFFYSGVLKTSHTEYCKRNLNVFHGVPGKSRRAPEKMIDNAPDKIVGLRGERKPPALAVGIANPLVSAVPIPKKQFVKNQI
jgi:hypothetical protein